MVRDITIMALDAETDRDVEKAQILARRKYLANEFLLRFYRR